MLDKSAIESWKDGLEEERSSMQVKVLENLLWICDHLPVYKTPLSSV